ncbi:hypothetical protein GIB67_027798, partial [Kingdonia uniflora]
IGDMVVVASIINATLVIPELDKQSFWQDTSNFSNGFDEYYFINTLGNDVELLVDRMKSYGPYIALHLQYEKDMLAFSACTHGLSLSEVAELTTIRENTTYWKVKEINSREQRGKGYCPLTPKEVAMFITSLGYPSITPIYIASGEIYGGDSHMDTLRSSFPLLMGKDGKQEASSIKESDGTEESVLSER